MNSTAQAFVVLVFFRCVESDTRSSRRESSCKVRDVLRNFRYQPCEVLGDARACR